MFVPCSNHLHHCRQCPDSLAGSRGPKAASSAGRAPPVPPGGEGRRQGGQPPHHPTCLRGLGWGVLCWRFCSLVLSVVTVCRLGLGEGALLSCPSLPMPRRSFGAGTRRVGEWGHPLGYERRGRHPSGVESEGESGSYAVPPPSWVRRGALAPSSLPAAPGSPSPPACSRACRRCRCSVCGRVAGARWWGEGLPSFGSWLGVLAKPVLSGRAWEEASLLALYSVVGGTAAAGAVAVLDRGGWGQAC